MLSYELSKEVKILLKRGKNVFTKEIMKFDVVANDDRKSFNAHKPAQMFAHSKNS